MMSSFKMASECLQVGLCGDQSLGGFYLAISDGIRDTPSNFDLQDRAERREHNLKA